MRRTATGADSIVSALIDGGVRVCFGLPGIHNLALWRALCDSPIRLVAVRHEQTAAYAADGYARATGSLGVALTTTGPGAANTLAAVGEAWASRSPVLIIATDIPSSLRRPGIYRGVLHETTDQAAMFAPIVKETCRAQSADSINEDIRSALQACRTLPHRPVYFEVPTDLLDAPLQNDVLTPCNGEDVLMSRPAHLAGDDSLDRAGILAARAKRPLIWAGSGAIDAGEEIADLAERLVAPVITTYGALGALPKGHPCLVALPPHTDGAGQFWDDADLVIAVGSDLDGVQTQDWAQPQPPNLITVNLDPVDATKNYHAQVTLTCEAAVGCRELARAVPQRDGLEGLSTRLAFTRKKVWEQLDPGPRRFLEALSHALPDDAVLVLDMCIPGYWAAGFWPPSRPRQIQVPLGWGTLGYALPAAIGAAFSGVGPIVSISGDGGFLYAPGELATIAQENIPLTIVVVNDFGYGMLRDGGPQGSGSSYGIDLLTPDFQALATSFGIKAETVIGLGERFGDALARHVADPQPSLLVALGPSLVPPPNTSPEWYRRR
jgi:thiamine pyrophosphate-dependent acetolactate synthase large subunit-like protein